MYFHVHVYVCVASTIATFCLLPCGRAPVSALRCSILLCEVLKERGLYRELTQIFIKMTSEVRCDG